MGLVEFLRFHIFQSYAFFFSLIPLKKVPLKLVFDLELVNHT